MKIFTVLKMDFKDLEEGGYTSITDYCRDIVKEGKDLPDRIEVYKGEMLCLTVSDVGLAATLQPTSRGWKKYTSRKVSKGRGCVKTSAQLP